MYFVIGSEFRGFHIRFRDVARGGIRIVKSINLQVRIQCGPCAELAQMKQREHVVR